jgi:hypothetical protein
MSMKVEIDDDAIDEIMETKLLETYKNLTRDIKTNSWGDINTEQFIEVVKGLELVGPWFVYNWDKKKKAKK